MSEFALGKVPGRPSRSARYHWAVEMSGTIIDWERSRADAHRIATATRRAYPGRHVKIRDIKEGDTYAITTFDRDDQGKTALITRWYVHGEYLLPGQTISDGQSDTTPLADGKKHP